MGNSKTAASIHSALLPQFPHYKGMLIYCKWVRMLGLLINFSDDHEDPTIYNIAVVNMVVSKYLSTNVPTFIPIYHISPILTFSRKLSMIRVK